MGFKIVEERLIVDNLGQPIDCTTCPCAMSSCNNEAIAIVVINSNGVEDDNFTVKLNGTSIGTVDNSSTYTLVSACLIGKCSGRIFSDSTQLSEAEVLSVFDCDSTAGTNFQSQSTFLRSLIVNGTNTLALDSLASTAQVCDNFGMVAIRSLYYDAAASTWRWCREYLEAFWDGFNGDSFSFGFTYP